MSADAATENEQPDDFELANDPEAARQVLERYRWEGDIETAIWLDQADGQPYLSLYGDDWPGAWKIPDGVKPVPSTVVCPEGVPSAPGQVTVTVVPVTSQPVPVPGPGLKTPTV